MLYLKIFMHGLKPLKLTSLQITKLEQVSEELVKAGCPIYQKSMDCYLHLEKCHYKAIALRKKESHKENTFCCPIALT